MTISTFLIIIISLGGINFGFRISCSENIIGTAKWHHVGDQKYLEINSSNDYNIGYLMGEKLSRKIIKLKVLLTLSKSQIGIGYQKLSKIAEFYQKFIPQNQLDEMRGIANGATHNSGIKISFIDILVQNTWIDIVYGKVRPQRIATVGCTSIVVSIQDPLNSSIENKIIIGGQNFDFTKIFQSTLSFILVHRVNNLSVFSLHMGGSLSLPIGKNNAGVSVLSTIIQSKTNYTIGLPLICRSQYALENAQNASNFIDYYFSSQISTDPIESINLHETLSYTMSIFDKKTYKSFEVNGNQTYWNNANVSIHANTYSIVQWRNTTLNPNYSVDRQNLAEILVNKALSNRNFSYSKLHEILATEPITCRTTSHLLKSETCAFFTGISFGIGKPTKENVANIPI
ncbi:MAG: hypothetical protein ACTSUI_02105 [Promethearchaeota archaeon]